MLRLKPTFAGVGNDMYHDAIVTVAIFILCVCGGFIDANGVMIRLARVFNEWIRGFGQCLIIIFSHIRCRVLHLTHVYEHLITFYSQKCQTTINRCYFVETLSKSQYYFGKITQPHLTSLELDFKQTQQKEEKKKKKRKKNANNIINTHTLNELFNLEDNTHSEKSHSYKIFVVVFAFFSAEVSTNSHQKWLEILCCRAKIKKNIVKQIDRYCFNKNEMRFDAMCFALLCYWQATK